MGTLKPTAAYLFKSVQDNDIIKHTTLVLFDEIKVAQLYTKRLYNTTETLLKEIEESPEAVLTRTGVKKTLVTNKTPTSVSYDSLINCAAKLMEHLNNTQTFTHPGVSEEDLPPGFKKGKSFEFKHTFNLEEE